MDDYGTFVNNYEAYTETTGGMEYELGRKPGLQALGAISGSTVLNFGCGPATNSRELRAMGAAVIGIDVSKEELTTARQRDPDGFYIHYDGVHLADALSNRQVDAILASFSVCAISDEVLAPLLRDMRKILGKGGRLVIIEPNLEKALGTRYPDLHYYPQKDVKSGDHVRVTLGSGTRAVELYHDIYRRHADYRRLLEEAGFTLLRVEQPRPTGWNLLRWLKAFRVPPFVIFVAE